MNESAANSTNTEPNGVPARENVRAIQGEIAPVNSDAPPENALGLLETILERFESVADASLLEEISEHAMNEFARSVSAQFGSIYLAHPAGHFQLYATQGDRELPKILLFPESCSLESPPYLDLETAEEAAVHLDPDRSLMVRVARAGTELFIPDIQEFRRQQSVDPTQQCHTLGESCVILPLTSGDHLYGILNLAALDQPISGNDPEQAELRRGLLLASRWVARQLAQSVTLANVQARARRDGLTALYNHSTFYDILDREVMRARRYESPLSLILLDIDRFKPINDDHGHLAGDSILRDLALRIQGALRGIDIPARYAGDEFAVILPETDLEGARQVAQRIQDNVARRPFHYGDAEISATVSVGVSKLKDGANSVDLVARTDELLYRAKRDGRNRVAG